MEDNVDVSVIESLVQVRLALNDIKHLGGDLLHETPVLVGLQTFRKPHGVFEIEVTQHEFVDELQETVAVVNVNL